jgi:hypothetical protein
MLFFHFLSLPGYVGTTRSFFSRYRGPRLGYARIWEDRSRLFCIDGCFKSVRFLKPTSRNRDLPCGLVIERIPAELPEMTDAGLAADVWYVCLVTDMGKLRVGIGIGMINGWIDGRDGMQYREIVGGGQGRSCQ